MVELQLPIPKLEEHIYSMKIELSKTTAIKSFILKVRKLEAETDPFTRKGQRTIKCMLLQLRVEKEKSSGSLKSQVRV